jgi:hypothetical protein
MLLEFPRSRARFVPPEDPPVLRYGVALLSSTVALLLTIYSPLVETRLLVFALAVLIGGRSVERAVEHFFGKERPPAETHDSTKEG